MTLGFAGAAWTNDDERLVMVAADTRISSGGSKLTDAGVKTYELGGRCAMVAAGHALPPMMAAELTRSLVENHNRRIPEKRVSFFDTVRLLSFFLKRAAEEQGSTSQAAASGFLEAGAPCVATIVVTPGFNKVAFCKATQGGTIAVPVGDPVAARLLLESMAEAKRLKQPVIQSALNILFYTAKLDGAFGSIGGGISVGTCMISSEWFSWPVIEIDDKRFLRGMDVTDYYRSGWPVPEVISYDEAWCVSQDKRVASNAVSEKLPRGGTLPGFDIDAIANPETLFASHHEPEI